MQMAPFGMNPKTKLPNLPNPTQKKALKWVDDVLNGEEQDHIPVLYIQGGVGSGKSRAVLAPVLEMLTTIPNIRILWGRQDFKDIKLSIMDKFFEVLPRELIVNKSEQYHYYDIQQEGDSVGRIYFNGLKDLSGFGSQEFSVIVVTETHEMTLNAYRTLKRRCRTEGGNNLMLLEGEPPNEDHWLAKVTNPAHEEYDPDITFWQISTRENWDNLPSAYTGSLLTMPDSWQKKYIEGEFGFQPDGTPYYNGFKETWHTGEFDWIKSKPLICGWDFGFHHPAVVFTQIDLQDRWVWNRELMGNDITIDKFCDQVKEYINIHFPGANCVHYGDPAVIQKTDKSEKTSWEICYGKGFNIIYKTSTYRERKEIIEQHLSTLIGGKPKILLDRRYCKTAVDGFLGGYHYPQRKPGMEFTDKFEQPYRDGYYEHIMNAAEYIAVNMFSPIKRDNTNTNRLRTRRVYEMDRMSNAGFGFGA